MISAEQTEREEHEERSMLEKIRFVIPSMAS